MTEIISVIRIVTEMRITFAIRPQALIPRALSSLAAEVPFVKPGPGRLSTTVDIPSAKLRLGKPFRVYGNGRRGLTLIPNPKPQPINVHYH